MIVSSLRLLALTFFVFSGGQLLQAQQAGGGGQTGGAGGQTGGTGGGTTGGSTIGAPSATGAGGALDADVAFSAVDRGATVGSTGGTGTGFSALSAASAGGGAQGGLSGLGGARGVGGGGLGGLGGLSSLFGGVNTQGQAAKPAIRTRLRSAVLYEPHPPEVVEQRVGLQFRSLTQPALRGVTVTMDGRKATISGVVETDRHRRMSEMLLRLEPGVSEIDNQLVVGTP